MILKALYDYYDRCKDLAPAGREYKEIAFVIVLDRDGNFVRLEDRRIDNKTASKFLVAKAVARTSAPVANLLWDNASYVLGISDANFPYDDSRLTLEEREKKEQKRSKKRDDNSKNHSVFIDKVKDILKCYPNAQDIVALNQFYNQKNDILQQLQQDTNWPEFQKNLQKNISFMIDGDNCLIAENKKYVFKEVENEVQGLCLVTGQRGNIVNITSSTMIQGSQSTAKLVACNDKLGYDSYGKMQGGNAPISVEAEFKYSTALKKMLERNSRNKFVIGSRTYLFWASQDTDVCKKAEEGLFLLFGNLDDNDPNAKIKQVQQVFMAIYSGTIKTTLDDKFYILGLAPNAARIAVVYWNECDLREFSKHIVKHFDDMEIVDTRKEKKPYFGIRAMMSAVTLKGKSSEVIPNLPDAVMRSIFEGTPYPYTLLAACITRIRAEQEIRIGRASMIKAYLNRLQNDSNKKLTPMIDKENTNQGYLCGRLFAVLEKMQEDANGSSSISSRYMNAASSTPAEVFPTLLNLSVHHAEKMRVQKQVFYDKLKSEIINKILANGFVTHLNLTDQGRFFVGYYHQRQDFFVSKKVEMDNKTEE